MELKSMIIPFILLGVLCGSICASIAEKRGVSFNRWFFLGFIFNVVGILFVSIALPNQQKLMEIGLKKNTHKKCKSCDEIVRSKALKCRYCHSTLKPVETSD